MEGKFIQVNWIRNLVPVAVHLIIDGDTVPAGAGSWCIGSVYITRLAIQRDGLEQELAARSSLHIDHQVVPGVAYGIAGNPARHPMASRIAPGVPFVAASDPAFVTPDVRLPPEELVDIKLQRLRIGGVSDPKPHVVGEIV